MILNLTFIPSKLYANINNTIHCSIKPKERTKISNGIIPLNVPTIRKKNFSTSEYLSILLKYSLKSLYQVDLAEEKIYSALLKQHSLDHPDRESNNISLFTIKKVITGLGYDGLAVYAVNNENTFQPSEFPEYKQIYLIVDYKNTYALITDYDAEKIGVYYATGEYCSVPQKYFPTYFKPIIAIIYRKIK